MRRILEIIDRISEICGKVFSGMILLVVATILYETISRFVFKAPTQWASESMVYGCALTYLLGGAWALGKNQHIKMELLYGRLSLRGRAAMDVATFFIFALYLVMFIYSASIYAWQSVLLRETTASSWDPPIYPLKVTMVLGAVLMLLQGLAKFIRDLHLAVKGKVL